MTESVPWQLDSSRWQVKSACVLSWRCWGDQWVVFDAGSGQTHSIDAITAATLSRIEQGPTDLAGLLDLACRESGLGDRDHWTVTLNDVIARLIDVDLIETAGP